jgi:hypothetical protein
MEDVRILVLLHKLGAKSKSSHITRQEWVDGCRRLRVDNLDKLKALLPSLELGFMEALEFREFFKVSHCGYNIIYHDDNYLVHVYLFVSYTLCLIYNILK